MSWKQASEYEPETVFENIGSVRVKSPVRTRLEVRDIPYVESNKLNVRGNLCVRNMRDVRVICLSLKTNVLYES